MNQYEIHVQQIMRYLLDRKLCLSSRISHQKCYDALSQFLTSETSDTLRQTQTNGLKHSGQPTAGRSVTSGDSIFSS